MIYILKPVQNDIVHSSKGKEWNNHKYISKKTNSKGKTVYIYSDNKNKQNKTSKYGFYKNDGTYVPKKILGSNTSLVLAAGGSHSFGETPVEARGRKIFEKAIVKVKERKLAKKGKKEEKLRKKNAEYGIYKNDGTYVPKKVLGSNTSLVRNVGASHSIKIKEGHNENRFYKSRATRKYKVRPTISKNKDFYKSRATKKYKLKGYKI